MAHRSSQASITQRPARSTNYQEELNPVSRAQCPGCWVKDVPKADREWDLALPFLGKLTIEWNGETRGYTIGMDYATAARFIFLRQALRTGTLFYLSSYS